MRARFFLNLSMFTYHVILVYWPVPGYQRVSQYNLYSCIKFYMYTYTCTIILSIHIYFLSKKKNCTVYIINVPCNVYWPEQELQKGFTDKVMLVFTVAIFPQESATPGDMEAVRQVMPVIWGPLGPVLVCNLKRKNDNSDHTLFP